MSMEEVAFQLILYAGNAKSQAMEAIECARDGKIDEAVEMVKVANQEMVNAHHIQTDLLTREAKGEKQEVGILMVHAQDHLNGAIMAIDFAEEFIHLYRMVYGLKVSSEER